MALVWCGVYSLVDEDDLGVSGQSVSSCTRHALGHVVVIARPSAHGPRMQTRDHLALRALTHVARLKTSLLFSSGTRKLLKTSSPFGIVSIRVMMLCGDIRRAVNLYVVWLPAECWSLCMVVGCYPAQSSQTDPHISPRTRSHNSLYVSCGWLSFITH